MPDVVLAVLIFGPLALAYFLKSNAALAFLALCAGFVLITLASADAARLLNDTGIISLSRTAVSLILLVAPLILTLMLTRKSFSGHSKFILQIVPGLCAGGLLALIVVPLLSQSLHADFANSTFWNSLQKIQPEIVAVGVLSSLLMIWAGGLKRHGRH